MHVLTQNLNL